MKTRKHVYATVKLSVPKTMTAAQVRKEIKTLVREQCFFMADEGDLKLLSVKPATK